MKIVPSQVTVPITYLHKFWSISTVKSHKYKSKISNYERQGLAWGMGYFRHPDNFIFKMKHCWYGKISFTQACKLPYIIGTKLVRSSKIYAYLKAKYTQNLHSCCLNFMHLYKAENKLRGFYHEQHASRVGGRAKWKGQKKYWAEKVFFFIVRPKHTHSLIKYVHDILCCILNQISSHADSRSYIQTRT